jgi:hypothetical protein
MGFIASVPAWEEIPARILSLCCIAVLVGCQTGGRPPDIAITAVPQTVILQRNAQGVTFQMTSVIRNAGPGQISVLPCGPQLQRDIEGRWQTVWSSPCLPESPAREILAGDSAIVPVMGAAFTVPELSPQLDPRFVGGSYRLLWSLTYKTDPTGPTKELPSDLSSSPRFTVTEAT